MKIFLLIIISVFFCTGFLGFFESNDEKNIKSAIEQYNSVVSNKNLDVSQKIKQLKNIDISNLPKDIRFGFKNMISVRINGLSCEYLKANNYFTQAVELFNLIAGYETYQQCMDNYFKLHNEYNKSFNEGLKKYGIKNNLK